MASKKPSGLGRGLGALLGDDVMNTGTQGAMYLPISEVESNSAQPRKFFDEAALAELADSIRQHGLIQPLTVRRLSSGYYQIIAGERRWRAARLAGLSEIPVTVIEADDRKAAELAMIENLQREDLNPMEEAAGYRSLIDQHHMTQEEAANRVGKSRSAVTNALRLLDLAPAVQNQVEAGLLSAGHARALVPLSSAQQVQAANAIIEGGLSVRQTEALAKRLAAGETPAAGQEHGGHHHGHGHGPHGGSMPAPDSLEGLLLRCGHALHHGGHGQKDLFAGLTQQEQDALRGLLQKLVGSWQEN